MTDRSWLLRTGGMLTLCVLFLVSVVIGIVYRRHRPAPVRPRLLAAFLDVGGGDCTLIRAPDGHTILVDAGPASAGPLIVSTLRRQGIRTLDLLVLASPSPGSVGGVPALLAGGIHVTRAWESPGPGTGPALRAALLAVRAHQIPSQVAHGGDTDVSGATRLTVLWPPLRGARVRAEVLVCRMDYGGSGIVLAGPADAEAVRCLVADAGDALSCDVLQVAAGGADGATPPELLRRAAPSVAVVSCDAAAPPGPQTLRHLEAAGAAVWRTGVQGPITVFMDGRGPPVATASHLTGK